MYMLQLIFLFHSFLFFLFLKFISIHYNTQKQWKIKINYNVYAYEPLQLCNKMMLKA